MSPLISQGVVFCTRSEEQPPGAGRGTFLLFLRLELSCLVESFLTQCNGLILICGDDFYPVHDIGKSLTMKCFCSTNIYCDYLKNI